MLVKSKVPASFVAFDKVGVSLDDYRKIYVNPFLVQSVTRSGQPGEPSQASITFVSGSTAINVVGTPEEVVTKLRAADE